MTTPNTAPTLLRDIDSVNPVMPYLRRTSGARVAASAPP